MREVVAINNVSIACEAISFLSTPVTYDYINETTQSAGIVIALAHAGSQIRKIYAWDKWGDQKSPQRERQANYEGK